MNFAEYSLELIRHRNRRTAGLIVVEQTESTNLLGRRIVEDYTREGATTPDIDLVAWRQLAGRGRRGRSWSSPPGQGVYATLIRSRAQSHWLPILPLWVAVALCEAVNRYLAGRCRLKWPNDLLVGDRKLGGILIEGLGKAKAQAIAIIGFGVNHGAELRAFGESRATSLYHEAASAPPAGPLAGTSLANVTLELLAAVDAVAHGDPRPEEIADRYRELSVHRPGDLIECRIGSELVRGTFRNIDHRGFLHLEVPGGVRVLAAGEVLSHD
ncbi:MAG: biotin--[acetyl-CoA-carboxylase] ligase [bacterium]|nr:biotin--[acetyl-CoA-carboxylase] ligase [bacterium]